MPPSRPAATVTATEFDASPPVDDARPDYRVGALAKGLRVLTCFDEQHPDWTVSDLVEATGFPMPTVYRLVMTLVGEGYLDQLPSGEYRPSVRALVLGTSGAAEPRPRRDRDARAAAARHRDR